MLENKLSSVFNQFQVKSKFYSYHEFTSGHINDTFLIKTKEKPYYVLQKINHKVFLNVPDLINNKVAVSNHLRKKLFHLPDSELDRRVLSFVKTRDGNNYIRGEQNDFWILSIYIEDGITHEKVENKELAFETGKLFGDFLNWTSDFDTDKLVEVIPKFHDMPFRYLEFENALIKASEERIEKAKDLIKIIYESREEMHLLQKLKESGAIQLRVTHNDTKISNALFDLNNKGLCVIDTDTVMPGVIHYDYGDAIRTICNTAKEDESNLELVEFNIKLYEAFTKGFLKSVSESLTSIELKHLPLGVKTMIFIMALRFLTDYLNDDIYYKTNYKEHNLDRARNQFKLLDSFNKKYELVKQITNQIN